MIVIFILIIAIFDLDDCYCSNAPSFLLKGTIIIFKGTIIMLKNTKLLVQKARKFLQKGTNILG